MLDYPFSFYANVGYLIIENLRPEIIRNSAEGVLVNFEGTTYVSNVVLYPLTRNSVSGLNADQRSRRGNAVRYSIPNIPEHLM